MLKKIATCAVLAVLGIVPMANAATVLVDFGRTDNRSSGTPTYNNLAIANGGTFPAPTAYTFTNTTFIPLNFIHNTSGTNVGSGTVSGAVASANLLDTTGVASGWTISFQGRSQGTTGQVGTAGSGGDYAGSFGSAPTISLFGSTALTDSLFVNNAGVLRVTITGLDNSQKYDLSAFGGRTGTATTFSGGYWSLVTGTSTTQQVYLDGSSTPTPLVNNTTLVDPIQIGAQTSWGDLVQLLGVTPSGGTIAFDLRTQNFTGNAITAINSLTIAAVPEPSTFALLAAGMGGICCIRLRRKQ